MPGPELAFVLAGLILTVYLIWRTVSVCRKFAPWVGWVVGLLDLGFLLLPALSLVGDLLRGLVVSGLGSGDWVEDLGTTLSGLGGIFPLLIFGFVVWKLFFFYAAFRWEPVRGLYHSPVRRPRAPFMRGPRRRRWREVPEPVPWFRGPSSY
jgi:hypothetical protein